jgi:hypothetical protein
MRGELDVRQSSTTQRRAVPYRVRSHSGNPLECEREIIGIVDPMHYYQTILSKRNVAEYRRDIQA